MTDNEMIKYLRTKGLGNGASLGSHSGTMDLIADRFIELLAENNNRQKAEIDRLNIELQAMRGAANSYKAENERLKKLLEEADVNYNRCAKRFYKEAIKEYREKAAIELAKNAHSDYWHWIDDVLYAVEKEVVGEAE